MAVAMVVVVKVVGRAAVERVLAVVEVVEQEEATVAVGRRGGTGGGDGGVTGWRWSRWWRRWWRRWWGRRRR